MTTIIVTADLAVIERPEEDREEAIEAAVEEYLKRLRDGSVPVNAEVKS